MNSCETPEIIKEAKYKKYIICASALFVACITFYVYLPVLQNNFVGWDDDVYVFENSNIKSLDYNFFKWVLTSEVNANWHPLTVLSYALDYAFWGLNPRGFHLTDIILHTANTLLVFILVIRLSSITFFMNANSEIVTEKLSPREGWVNSNNLAAAIVAALLFGLHPLHVESVAWISERKDLLYAFFYLLSLIFYIKYASLTGNAATAKDKKFNKWQQFKFYSLSFIMFVLSISSKAMAVSLPVVLLMLDIYPFKRFSLPYVSNPEKGTQDYNSAKMVLFEKIPFIVVSFLSSVVTIWAQKKGGALQTAEAYPIIDRFFVAGRAYVFYLWKMIQPYNLAPLYPYPNPKDISIFSLEYTGAFLLLLFITYRCLRSASPVFLVVWFYYIITLIPAIGLVQSGVRAAADRYTYLPVLGFFILAGIGIQYLLNRYSNKRYAIIFLIAIAGVIGIFSIMADMTMKQISIWKDTITLWSHEIKLFPDEVCIAYYNRGFLYYKIGNYKQAMADYNKAIEIDNKYAWAYNNRANVYYELGNYQEAVKDYKNTIEYDPNITEAYYNLGLAYSKLGDNYMANDFYKKAKERGFNNNQGDNIK